jgi:hypothetical protein
MGFSNWTVRVSTVLVILAIYLTVVWLGLTEVALSVPEHPVHLGPGTSVTNVE